MEITEVTIRTFRADDIPAMVKIFNAEMEACQIPDRVDEQVLRHQLASPFAYPTEDFFIAVDAGDQPVGFAINLMHPRTGRGFGLLSVYPLEVEVKSRLLEVSDAQLMRRAEQVVAPELPVYIIRQAMEIQADDRALLESAGYSITRNFYEMHIAFDGVIEAPVFPSGIEIRPFDQAEHAHAVHYAQQEAFRDHWGHTEDTPFEEWVRRFQNPQYDPSLYLIAWEGDEVAGIAFCNLNQGEPDAGWVDILGVRRAWRKRGLGMALLRHAFYQFQQRGWSKAGLGVDAASKTNAVALYERAGMHIRSQVMTYRKVLRGNPADIVD